MKCQNCGTEIQEQAKFCPKCGSKVEQPPAVKVPVTGSIPHDISNIWPEWQIQKQLGRGSYGVVYQAIRRDNNVESHAAIKIISIPSDSSEVDSLRSEGLDMDGTRTYFKGIVDDFVSEIQLLESLKGIQNIVSVEDYKVVEKSDTIGWDIYIRMELLTPFNTYICDKTLTEEEIIKLGTDICTALEICGQRNIIHRDIKPENIFVNDFGYFKLGDFGIARKLENMTGGLSQKGTFNYMAPEVANSSEYDARVDTYSLGIVLYRLLNGNRLPFLDTEKQLLNPNERRTAVERRIRGEDLPAPCDASPAMADLILRACAYDPSIRFASATEMKEALMSVSKGTCVLAPIGNLDKTTSVRRAPDENDKTTAVRKAPTGIKSQPVNTFGSVPKKKSKLPKVLLLLLLILLLIGGGIFAAAQMINNGIAPGNGDGPSQTQTNTSEDGEKIASIISEAEALVSQNNYAAALSKVQEGLEKYPESVELQEKVTEYEKMIEEEAVTVILAEADALASAEDYEGALAKVQSGLETYPNSAKLQAKADQYAKAIENQAIEGILAEAEALASAEDYEGALAKVQSGLKTYPKSTKLQTKANQYAKVIEDQVVASILEEAAIFADAEDYESALEKIQKGLSTYPQSALLKSKKTEYTNARNAQIKADVLAEAKSYADIEDYETALSIIKKAQDSYGNNADYQSAYNTYNQKYIAQVKSIALSDAEKLAKSKDYKGAIEILENALVKIGSDSEISTKIQEYEKLLEEEEKGKEDLPSGTIRDGEELDVKGGSSKANAKVIKLEDINHASFTTSGNDDWFKVTVSSNYSLYRFELANLSIDSRVNIFVYDALEQKLGNSICSKGDSCYVDIKLEAGKTYYIKISREWGNYLGNYKLTVNEHICDAGATQTEAFNILLEKEYVKTFDVSGYDDWYKITTSANYSLYRLKLDNLSIESRIIISVYDEYNAQLGNSKCSKGDSCYVDLKLEAGKTYYIKISREWSGNYLGNYKLSVRGQS
ncbi:MAG: protein kinase [Clostridia bacterium]|nr:protein kinase [Clostridia bacterium]